MFTGAFSPVHVAVVAIVALLVLGPEKLPDAARSGARLWRDFQAFRAGLRDHVRDFVDEVAPPEIRGSATPTSPATPPAGQHGGPPSSTTSLPGHEHESPNG